MLERLHMLATGAILVALIGGCAGDEAPTQPILPDCASDSDCASDEVCVEGYCSVEQQQPLELDFRFFPQQSSSYRPQRVDSVAVEDGARLNFGLEPAVSITSSGGDDNTSPGGILYEGAQETEGPTGNLLFTRSDVEDSRFNSQVRVDQDGFDALLHPATYNVTFIPDQEVLSQRTWTDVALLAPEKLTRRYPHPDTYRSINGSVRRDSPNSGPREVEGAKVFATADDGNVVSAATTTNSDGVFSLELPPGVGPYTVHVGPSLSNPMVPKVVFQDSVEPTLDGCIDDQGVSIVCPELRLDLGDYDDEAQSFELELSPTDEDWSGTRVFVNARIGSGVYERTFSVDPNGRTTIELFPNRYYEVDIVPPIGSRYATTSIEVSLTEGQTELPNEGIVEMEGKTRLRGVLLDSDGDAVAFERVEFEPDAVAAASSGEDIDLRVVSTQTDERGQFEVFLEGVVHDVYVRPSQGSGLPVTRRQVSASVIRTSSFAEIRLAQPRVLVGTVLSQGGAGEPLGGVAVRAYQRVGEELRLVGEAQSDPGGRTTGDFRMVISADLE
jgi:hypothetical protein